MIEIRFHGRGGQGVVTSADILAVAAFKEGKYTLSFPMFGAEKRGTPVLSFLRVSDRPIVIRDEIYNPDYVVVLDPTVMDSVRVQEGIKETGIIVANYPKPAEELKKKLNVNVKVVTLNATKLAIEVLGRPITNTVMVGALIGVTDLVKLETLRDTVLEWFENKKIAEKNAKLVEIAYNTVKGEKV